MISGIGPFTGSFNGCYCLFVCLFASRTVLEVGVRYQARSWDGEDGGVKGSERREALGESGGVKWNGEGGGDNGVYTGEAGGTGRGSGGDGVVDEEAAAEVEEAGPEVGEPKTLALIAESRPPPKDYSKGPRVSASWVWPGSQRGVGRSVSRVSSFGRDYLGSYQF